MALVFFPWVSSPPPHFLMEWNILSPHALEERPENSTLVLVGKRSTPSFF